VAFADLVLLAWHGTWREWYCRALSLSLSSHVVFFIVDVRLGAGKDVNIKFVSLGVKTADGEVQAHFELNGVPRTLYVRDERKKIDVKCSSCSLLLLLLLLLCC
jgi:hypothetical protein